MALLPYALRPKVVLRSQIVKRGVIGGNPFLRPIAMMMVGQSVYVRRSALRQGLILGNPMWRFIGVLVLGQELYKAALKKTPERLAVERIGPGHRVTVRRHGAESAVESPRTARRVASTRGRSGRERRGSPHVVKVLLRNPRREVEFDGPRSVDRLLDELQLSREAHLVICNGTLVPGDAVLGDDDQIEVRPVISGGA